jgi:hypothetical protein
MVSVFRALVRRAGWTPLDCSSAGAGSFGMHYLRRQQMDRRSFVHRWFLALESLPGNGQ